MATPDVTGPERFVAVDFPEEADWRLALDPGGSRLAVSWADAGSVMVANAGTGRVIARPKGFHRVSGVAFLSARELLVTAFGGCFRCPLPRGERGPLSDQGWQSCVAVSPCGGLVALGTDEGLELRDLRVGGSRWLRAGNGRQHARRAAFSPGGRYVAAELGNESARQPSLVGVWDAHTGRRQRVFDTTAFAFAFRGDTPSLALVDDNEQIVLYEADMGEDPAARFTVEQPWAPLYGTGPARALQFRDGGRTLAVLLPEGNFVLFDIEAGRVVRRTPPPAGRKLWAAVPSGDWSVFAAAAEDGVVIWPGDMAGR
jgi:hypothetical protein